MSQWFHPPTCAFSQLYRLYSKNKNAYTETTPWTKNVPLTVLTIASMTTDKIFRTIQSTLFKNAIYCPGCHKKIAGEMGDDQAQPTRHAVCFRTSLGQRYSKRVRCLSQPKLTGFSSMPVPHTHPYLVAKRRVTRITLFLLGDEGFTCLKALNLRTLFLLRDKGFTCFKALNPRTATPRKVDWGGLSHIRGSEQQLFSRCCTEKNFFINISWLGI